MDIENYVIEELEALAAKGLSAREVAKQFLEKYPKISAEEALCIAAVIARERYRGDQFFAQMQKELPGHTFMQSAGERDDDDEPKH